MSEQRLYELLKTGESKDIPWDRAAAHFLKLKVASGGLLPTELDQLEKAAAAGLDTSATDAQQRLDYQQKVKAQKRKGILSGLRGAARADVTSVENVKRTRGQRVGKNTGMAAGAGTALALSRKAKDPKTKILAAALGGLMGRQAGQAVGEEVDRKRTVSKYKPKTAAAPAPPAQEPAPEKKKAPKGSRAALAGSIAAGAGAGAGAEYGSKYKETAKRVVATGTSASGAKKYGIPPMTAEKLRKSPGFRRLVMESMGKGSKASPKHWLRGGLGGAAVGSLVGLGIHHGMKKNQMAKEGAAPMNEPAPLLEAPPAAPAETPVDDFLTAQQQANEAEFFKEQAEIAAQEAAAATERAEMAEQQAAQLQEDTAQQQQAAQEQTAMATQQAQQAQQEAAGSKQEALTSQDENIKMRQAVTDYRQALMNLLSQDPTQVMAPPVVPEAPAGPPPGAPPAEMAPPPGAPPADPQAAMPPPEAAPPPGPPPAAPPAPAGGAAPQPPTPQAPPA